MIEKELALLKDTEEQAGAILREAEKERLEILSKAKRDAQRRHESIIQGAHGEGESHLEGIISQIEANKKVHLHDLDDKMQQTRELGESRIEYAVKKIFEGMWENGHSSDE